MRLIATIALLVLSVTSAIAQSTHDTRPIDPLGINDPAGRPINPAGIGQRSRSWGPGDVNPAEDPLGTKRDLAGRPIKPDGIGDPAGEPTAPTGIGERADEGKRGS